MKIIKAEKFRSTTKVNMPNDMVRVTLTGAISSYRILKEFLKEFDNDIELYRPSTGSEGMMFEDHFCGNCKNQNETCNIMHLSMSYETTEPEYPKELIYDSNDNPTCTRFKQG